ncbi:MULTISPECIES: thiol-disulfide oxidoreductase DCC family protein [Nonlabens]|uniref:thiol-disulfide oxidoreductase DCC family protein n=1 Tax=Nonlabens TaxID=363408 RepID=UPI000CF4324B|nr:MULTISPECIES: thiol-disulfide oxidoreductase DCC family protein [Nonlabens]MEE2802003.1 thiol-disulfide oxidoreductase DCC family protein [Bacteroidota bacterium]PQJ16946.1 thiol-disulfide oxidoreductase [Nonlabens tegetincola]
MQDKKIILFDGVCNLCNGAVVFIIKRDKKDVFRFAALQSEIGEKLLRKHQIDPEKTDSIILVDDNNAFAKAGAALRIAQQLSGLWPALAILRIVPRFISNAVYDWIASNRYQWFGKKESCMIPTPELKAKFL